MEIQRLEKELLDLKETNKHLKEQLIDTMKQVQTEIQAENERKACNQIFGHEFDEEFEKHKIVDIEPRKFKTVSDVDKMSSEANIESRIAALTNSLPLWESHLNKLRQEVAENQRIFDELK